MTFKSWLAIAVASASSCFGGLAHSDTTFDVAADFSSISNPTEAWQYGWSSTTVGSSFNLDTASATISGLNVWQGIPGSDAFGNPTILFVRHEAPLYLRVEVPPGKR